MDKYTDLLKKIKNLREEAKKEAQAALQTGFQDFFEKYPTLQTISWRQYTPYFNDGDTCTFSVNSDATLNGVDNWGDVYDDEDDDGNPLPKMSDEAFDEISEFIAMFDEEDMLAVYGDHARVIVKRDGTTDVDDYSHD